MLKHFNYIAVKSGLKNFRSVIFDLSYFEKKLNFAIKANSLPENKDDYLFD